MSASLSPERSFAGHFFQMTTTTKIDALDTLWGGWKPGWGAWSPGPINGFVTQYSPRVVANLREAHGEEMDCFLILAVPASGMSRGGSGECQVGGGERIDVTFQRD